MGRGGAAPDAARLIEGFYDGEARVLPHHLSPLATPAEIRRYWQRLFDEGLTGLALDTTHLEVSGNLAYAVGSYAAVLEPAGGPPARLTGKYLVVYRRRESLHWRAVAHMFAGDQ